MTSDRGPLTGLELRGFLEEARGLQRAAEQTGIPGTMGLLSCPHDGTPLMFRERDHLWSCPMGDYATHAGPRGVP